MTVKNSIKPKTLKGFFIACAIYGNFAFSIFFLYTAITHTVKEKAKNQVAPNKKEAESKLVITAIDK